MVVTCGPQLPRILLAPSGLTPAKTHPTPSATLTSNVLDGGFLYACRVNPAKYAGGKYLGGPRGIDRLGEFCEKAFSPTTAEARKTLVVGGHSLWFRNFFNHYLPAQHLIQRAYAPSVAERAELSRTKKIFNGGLVSFRLQKLKNNKKGGKTIYRIDPGSIRERHLGFEGRKTKIE